MKKGKILHLIILTSAFFTACMKEEKVTTIEKAKWLEGTWEGKTNGGLIYFEKWVVVNDTLMRNINFHMGNGNDTIVGGKSALSVRDGKLVYSNMIGNKEEIWRTTKLNDIEMVFENGGVSHAQKISFFKAADDRWEASLYGKKDTSSYTLKKISN